LRGRPEELALGMALGIFCGLMPVLPFQTVLAVFLALCLKASKITAALGTWISNPLNWYFVYYYSYKIGAGILGLSEREPVFASVMASIEAGEKFMDVVGKILGASSAVVAAFLLGGVLMGIVFATPGYFIFLKFFRSVGTWRHSRKEKRLQRASEK
jgi:uncharacterized protein (DUF2062 family)